MTDAILVLNAGSSSLKFALFEAATLEPLLRGGLDALGSPSGPHLNASGPLAASFEGTSPSVPSGEREVATEGLMAALRGVPGVSLVCAGHRVVHGGRSFQAPVLIDAGVLAAIEALAPLAPAHQPHNAAGIRAVGRMWPDLPQVACFDTAFHRTQPAIAQCYAIPRELTEQGYLRYGFHGISYQYIAGVLHEAIGGAAKGRVIVAHLGHGASLCGLLEGTSIATTMGFTALEGLMMGERSGSVDPGLVLHLLTEKAMPAREVADLLYNRSGLLGVSGISADVRTLEASADPRAAEALDLFAYRVVREAGSLMAALGGLDAVVFTAGIGENSATVREKICRGLAFAGVELDEDANARSSPRISRERSRTGVFVIATNEELPIAKSCKGFIGSRAD
jgi:acetate kinase